MKLSNNEKKERDLTSFGNWKGNFELRLKLFLSAVHLMKRFAYFYHVFNFIYIQDYSKASIFIVILHWYSSANLLTLRNTDNDFWFVFFDWLNSYSFSWYDLNVDQGNRIYIFINSVEKPNKPRLFHYIEIKYRTK